MLSPAHLCKLFNKNLSFCLTASNTSSYSVFKMSEQKWEVEKARLLKMPLEEKRGLYKVPDYLTLNKVDPWMAYIVKNPGVEGKKHTLEDLTEFEKIKTDPSLNKSLSQTVSLFRGDITKLEVDAIVNAANSRLRAGGGVDGAIHRAAGPLLQEECNTLGGCPTGEVKITCGYDLPAKYVIHTVGPQDGSASKLTSCYEKAFALQDEYNLKSIAFPCISTGIYGFPNRLAAHIALRTARKALEANKRWERVIFCTFLQLDVDIYETLMKMYFPVHDRYYNDGASLTEQNHTLNPAVNVGFPAGNLSALLAYKIINKNLTFGSVRSDGKNGKNRTFALVSWNSECEFLIRKLNVCGRNIIG